MKTRILLISDMHYSTEETHEEMLRINPCVNTSVAAGRAFGMKQSKKISRIYEDICTEHKKESLDLVLVLGDLSIDDYSFRNLPDNYCRRFRNECMSRLPCPSVAIPGNHDSYPEELWQEVFIYGRQFCYVHGGALFVMLDNFNSCPASSASGSPYTLTDTEFLRKALEQYPDIPVFLCAHYFAVSKESEEFKRIVRDNPRIVCLFRGHTHHNALIPLGEEWGDKLLVDIGGYAYHGFCENGVHDYNRFSPEWAWGYQMLELDGNSATLWHRKPAMHYRATNGDFDFPGTYSDKICLSLR